MSKTTAQAKQTLLDLRVRLKEAQHRRMAQLSVDTLDLAWLVEAAAHTTLAAAPGDRVVALMSSCFEEAGVAAGTEGTVRGYDLATHRVRFDGVDWDVRVSWGQVDVLPKEGA